VSASVIGVANLLRFYCLARKRDRQRKRQRGPAKTWRSARIAGQYLPFGPHLALGVALVLLFWEPHLAAWFLGS
jgi:hypothetical protein